MSGFTDVVIVLGVVLLLLPMPVCHRVLNKRCGFAILTSRLCKFTAFCIRSIERRRHTVKTVTTVVVTAHHSGVSTNWVLGSTVNHGRRPAGSIFLGIGMLVGRAPKERCLHRRLDVIETTISL